MIGILSLLLILVNRIATGPKLRKKRLEKDTLR